MSPEKELLLQKILSNAHYDFEKGLNTHAFFKVNDKMTGEDLVQDTFKKTWAFLVKGGRIDMMRAFLYHILNDLIVDEYRKRKSVSLDALLEKGFEPSIKESERLYNILDGRSAILLINKLPKAYREIMNMRYIQDLSIKEMSLLTGQSKNSIAVLSCRGLQKLKVLYNNTFRGGLNSKQTHSTSS